MPTYEFTRKITTFEVFRVLATTAEEATILVNADPGEYFIEIVSWEGMFLYDEPFELSEPEVIEE